MQSVRAYFSAMFGNLQKPIFVFDAAGEPIWQNAAADAWNGNITIAELQPLVAEQGRSCLENRRGLTVQSDVWALDLIPQEVEGALYLVVRPEKQYEAEQEAAMRVFRNASAKLNSYLNRIYGAAQQLGLDTPAGAQLGKEVHHILRMSNHLYQLMDRGGSKEYVVPMAVVPYLQEFARAVEEMKPQLQIVLAEMEPDLYVKMMPENMELILAALISNAYRFGNGLIALKAERKGEAISIAVWDNGPGAEDAAQLFQWGYRTADQKGALGMGFSLPMAQSLLKAQGGSLHYHRINDQTCFEILLQPSDIPAGTRMAEWSAEPISNSLSQLRVELSDIL